MTESEIHYTLAQYIAYRSSALWFAGQDPSPTSLQTKDGAITLKYGEVNKWAYYWHGLLQELWLKLLSVHAVQELCTGIHAADVSSVAGVDSQHGTKCICPKCTLEDIKTLDRSRNYDK